MGIRKPLAPPQISVVVPCRGDGDVLAGCLNALKLQTCSFSFEVIVVESAGDPAVERLLSALTSGSLVRSEGGLLPGAARNLGAKAARGAFIAFTDADCQPRPDWLAGAARALEKGAKLVGGPVGHALPLHPVAVADNTMQFIDYLPGRRAGATDHLAGCNLALRRCDFLDHGGFREDLIVGEDSLFIEDAARRWGKLVRFVPQMAVDHRGRRALAAFWHHQLRFGYHRALLGSRLKPALRRHGRSLLGTGYFCLRRFCYFFLRLAQWDPLGLPRFLLLVPLTAFGLAGYGKGFRKGCREAEAPADE